MLDEASGNTTLVPRPNSTGPPFPRGMRGGNVSAEDGSIAVWRISDGEKIGSISAAHEGGVRAVAIASPTCVISSGNDGCVRVWLVSGDPRLRMLHKMSTGPAPLASLAFWM